VNDEPSLRRPGRDHWSGPTWSKRSARASPEVSTSSATVPGACSARQGGLVLVPGLEERVVLLQHQREPSVEDPEHIAHVAAVLERRPGSGRRSRQSVLAHEEGSPGCTA
jgi:hypothetical protein